MTQIKTSSPDDRSDKASHPARGTGRLAASIGELIQSEWQTIERDPPKGECANKRLVPHLRDETAVGAFIGCIGLVSAPSA